MNLPEKTRWGPPKPAALAGFTAPARCAWKGSLRPKGLYRALAEGTVTDTSPPPPLKCTDLLTAGEPRAEQEIVATRFGIKSLSFKSPPFIFL